MTSVNESTWRCNANLHKCDEIWDGCHKAALKLPKILTEDSLHSDSSESRDRFNVAEVHVPKSLSTSCKNWTEVWLLMKKHLLKQNASLKKKYPEAKI